MLVHWLLAAQLEPERGGVDADYARPLAALDERLRVADERVEVVGRSVARKQTSVARRPRDPSLDLVPDPGLILVLTRA